MTLRCPSGHPVVEHDVFCGQCGVAVSGSTHAEPPVYAAARNAGSATRRTRTVLLVAIALTVAATAAALRFAQRENDSTSAGSPAGARDAAPAPTPRHPKVGDPDYTVAALAFLCGLDPDTAQQQFVPPTAEYVTTVLESPDGQFATVHTLTSATAEPTLGWSWQVTCSGKIVGRFTGQQWGRVFDVGASGAPGVTAPAPPTGPGPAVSYAPQPAPAAQCAADERPNAEQSVGCLVTAWIADDRVAATTHATPSAVEELFDLSPPETRFAYHVSLCGKETVGSGDGEGDTFCRLEPRGAALSSGPVYIGLNLRTDGGSGALVVAAYDNSPPAH